MSKIIFFEINEEEKKNLLLLMSGIEADFCAEKLSMENINLTKEAEIVSVFVNSTVDKEIIDAMPNLKFITTRSTGYDHVDVKYLKEKGISVSNVPAYGSRTVAEHAFALMLELSKKIGKADKEIKDKNNFGVEIRQFEGFDLFGKTVGIVGTGKIGKNSARIAKGFGMKVLGTDLYPDNDFAEEVGMEYVPLDVLISQSDIVTLHTPYNETTHHLINKENIKSIKSGAYIINTSRGEVVETEALLFALENNLIKGAGLDVLECERKMKDEMNFLKSKNATDEDKKIIEMNHKIIDMKNVVVSPHTAFYTREAVEEILKVTAGNVLGFIKGELVNLVK